VTDYAGTKPVSMPFCTRRDMETVAEMIRDHPQPITISSQNASCEAREGKSEGDCATNQQSLSLPEKQTDPVKSSHRLTPEILQAQLTPEGTWGQREIERQTGVNQSKISKLKNGNLEIMSDAEKDLIWNLLFGAQSPQKDEPKSENQDNVVLALAENQIIQ
jgi:hypothetical protein